MRYIIGLLEPLQAQITLYYLSDEKPTLLRLAAFQFFFSHEHVCTMLSLSMPIFRYSCLS